MLYSNIIFSDKGDDYSSFIIFRSLITKVSNIKLGGRISLQKLENVKCIEF